MKILVIFYSVLCIAFSWEHRWKPDYDETEVLNNNDYLNFKTQNDKFLLPVDFQYNGIMTSLKVINIKDKLLIIFGTHKEAKGIYHMNDSQIVSCLIDVNKNVGKTCKRISHINSTFVGPSLDSIELKSEKHVLVYCDYYQKSVLESCSLKIYNVSVDEFEDENVQFSNQAGNFGFSVSLYQQSESTNILIGAPSIIESGFYSYEDIFRSITRNVRKKVDTYMGYSVDLNYNQVVSAPNRNHSYVYVSNYMISDPDYPEFNFFGHSVLSFQIADMFAVIVTAPFYSKEKVNAGKLYLFCSTNFGMYKLGDVLIGRDDNEYMGYEVKLISKSINRIGVLSPYLRDSSKSKLAIYTILQTCKFKKKPTAVLYSEYWKKGFVKLSNVDLNNDGEMDIVVGMPNSQFVAYLHRKTIKVNCEFNDRRVDVKNLKESDIKTITTSFDTFKLDKDVIMKPQIDLNYGLKREYFELISIKTDPNKEKNIQYTYKIGEPLYDVDLSHPIRFAFRYLLKCADNANCDNGKIPLLSHSSNCIREFEGCPTCKDTDLSIIINDKNGSLIYYHSGKAKKRFIDLTITNEDFRITEKFNVTITVNRIYNVSNIACQKVYCHVERSVSKSLFLIISKKIDHLDKLSVGVELEYNGKINEDHSNISVHAIVGSYKDLNLANNIATLKYRFVYLPNISIDTSESKVHQETMNRPLQSQAGKRVLTEKIGPPFKQMFEIKNHGPGILKNFKIILSFPSKLSHMNQYIVYLFKEIYDVNLGKSIDTEPSVKIDGKSVKCEYNQLINPMNIRPLIYNSKNGKGNSSRVKREIDGEDDSIEQISQAKMERIPIEMIKCDRQGLNLPEPECFKMTCDVKELRAFQKVQVKVHGLLYAATFFDYKIADAKVFLKLMVDYQFNKIPPGIETTELRGKQLVHSKRYVFKNIRLTLSHHRQIWPTIVGIAIGLLLLAVIIVAMYKCDFFKVAQRRRELENMGLGLGISTDESDAFAFRNYNPNIVHQYDSDETFRR